MGFVVFCISFYKSVEEFRYYLHQEVATAQITKIKEKKDRHGHSLGWRISYKFHNPTTNEQQKGRSTVDVDTASQLSVRQKISIAYCGETLLDSRLEGMTNRIWVFTFLGSMTLTIVSVAALSWHSVLEERKLRKRKWWIR